MIHLRRSLLPGTWRSRRGAAAIEFGFWVPILVIMLGGLIDLSWYMAQRQSVMQAARDGARYAAASRDDTSTTGVNERHQAAIDGSAWVNTAIPAGCDPANVTEFSVGGLQALRVTVSCNYEPLMGLVLDGILPANLVMDFTMFIEIQT